MTVDIFTEINSLPESTIAHRLGLSEAKDGKSYICPICGHGKSGDGLRYRSGRWECYGPCGRSRSNVDLIAACYDVDTRGDKAELAKRLREIFFEYEETKPKSFSFSMEKRKDAPVDTSEQVSTPRLFNKLYHFCREKFPLKEFVEVQGGKWRGLTYETLSAANCVHHAEYTLGEGVKVPALLVPYDNEFYFWREVDGKRRGVPAGTSRKPYFAVPISLDFPNLIVEGEVDALSIKQVWTLCGEYISGIIATGSAVAYRQMVAELERQFGESKRKPSFVVLFDNDETGEKHGRNFVDALRAAHFPAERVFLARVMAGEYVINGVKKYQPKVDANDLLQQGEEILLDRLMELYDDACYWLQFGGRGK